jgi:dTDP-4-dehydrorhamnose reductase
VFSEIESARDLEVWGGLECSITRVGDAYHSQLAMNGHYRRSDDLARIARLGIRVVRYPVLWEQLQGEDGLADPSQHSRVQLQRLRDLGIMPIVGLLHHGSGPRSTDLLDPRFAEKLAFYAGEVAARFPWVRDYTPVNEPLTTARFSCLYGLWHPHARDDVSFVRALINQCRGTVLAMREIRRVNPAARLIQTEDLGRCYSTRGLRYQAEFENQRRWLTWDLLCGRVTRRHALWGYLSRRGLTDDDLAWFAANPCPPQMIGINHYVTSDRFLHGDVDEFPPQTRGGNGRHRYADLEAVRVLRQPGEGIVRLLRDAWKRYGIPLALTEVHLACTRDEQLRWLHEAWRMAQEARAAGIDVRAVTPWALFGSFDWDSLMTRIRGHYEPGAFDVRGSEPRPTALARLVSDLAGKREPHCSEILATSGWWRRPGRLLQSVAVRERGTVRSNATEMRPSARPLLITGAQGTLGHAFVRLCGVRGLHGAALSRAELDIADPDAVDAALDRHRPWAVVNAAGYVRVDSAEQDRERCFRENVEGPAILASACASRGLPIVTFSSDLVFDGRSAVPYVETDAVSPLSVYGESKARADREVLASHPDALVVRTSAFFGPWDAHNFLTRTLQTLRDGGIVSLSDTGTVSPTYIPDLVNATLDLLLDHEHGLWHLTNQGSVSWMEFALEAARVARLSPARFQEREYSSPTARRPAYSAMTSCRSILLPTLDDALQRYAAASVGRV